MLNEENINAVSEEESKEMYLRYLQEHSEQLLYDNTLEFNILAGNLDKAKEQPEEFFDSQVKVIEEEFNELKKAFKEKNLVEMLDGCVDLMVTVFGLVQGLEYSFDLPVRDAEFMISNNNLSKFLDTKEQAEESKQWYGDRGVLVEVKETQGKYALIDVNGKVRKGKDYEPVDLSTLFAKGE